ncbi:MAG: histone family protein [Theionarchaea archaeon]|nr:histone family protein [Theionarchaea archaeon]
MPLPLASVEKLIRKAGAHRVSKGAAKELASYLDDVAIEIAREAVILSEHAGRKTVRAEDINLSRKRLSGQLGDI